MAISMVKKDAKQNDFAYAMYRDELKGREGCNPDINIEQKDNQSNPHWTKFEDANAKYLGLGNRIVILKTILHSQKIGIMIMFLI